MDNLDHLLTLILIIRDRPFYTFRWMEFANASHFPFKIFIADGGKDDSVVTQLQDKSRYPNLNYEYKQYPYDATPREYFWKITDALERVTTPYVVLADDDDFWNVEGLRASIQFLENNSDFATCRGRNFTFSQNKKNSSLAAFNPHTIFDIAQTSPSARVLAIYPTMGGTFYDVHRAKDYALIFKKVAEINPHFLPMAETMISLLDASAGKIKQLDVAYLMREDGHGQSTSRSQDWLSRILTGPCAENLASMTAIVAHDVSTRESIDVDAFKNELQTRFFSYIAPHLANHLYAYYDISFSKVISNFKTWLIYFVEKRAIKTGKLSRTFAEWRHSRKNAAAFQSYLKNNSNEKSVFQNIKLFLKDHN